MKKVAKQTEFDLKARRTWSFSPVEKVKPSKKIYNRQAFKKGAINHDFC